MSTVNVIPGIVVLIYCAFAYRYGKWRRDHGRQVTRPSSTYLARASSRSKVNSFRFKSSDGIPWRTGY
jgi:hypothetical protein